MLVIGSNRRYDGVVKVVPRILVAVTLLFGCSSAQSAERRIITPQEANNLMFTMLTADRSTRASGFNIDGAYQSDPGFVIFYVHYGNPSGTSKVVLYAVDDATGDVWYRAICARLTSPALRRLQRRLRKRIGLTHAGYTKLRRPGPSCDPGEVSKVMDVGTHEAR